MPHGSGEGHSREGGVKVYQVSTNLVPVNISKGAGEIDVLDDVVPTPTEWETYIAQIQAMIDDIEDMDIDVSKEGRVTTITIHKKDGTIKTVEILDGEKGEQGDPGPQGLPGTPGRDGTDGRDGADAKINGVNTLTITAGDNVHINQSGSTMTISADMYDDTDVKQDIQALNSDVEWLGTGKQDKQDDDLDTEALYFQWMMPLCFAQLIFQDVRILHMMQSIQCLRLEILIQR